MNASGLLERNKQLPPLPASAARARRLVREAMASTVAGSDLVDTAVLLASEIVTNAVLHAGTGIDIRVVVLASGVRVEVRDGSAVMPSHRGHNETASTGRGLDMVEILARVWGTSLVPGGKVVWFELGGAEDSMEDVDSRLDPSPSTGDRGGHGSSDHSVVRLAGLAPALVLATLEYADAVLREVALASVYDHRTVGSSAKTLDLHALLLAVSDAVDQGVAVIDLDVTFPIGAADEAQRLMEAVEEAHRLALDGQLLALPAVPEIMMCHSWLMGEISGQVGGEPPTPWVLPAPIELDNRFAPLTDQERSEVESLAATVVVGDDANRIVHASENIEELLGWPADELIGRRLTTIVPPDLRERHLVGFTRFQLTGDGPIIGKATSVPALTRDGTIVQVALRIDVVVRASGARMFCAQIRDDPGPN